MSRKLISRIRESKFRGTESFKLSPAALKPVDTFRIVAKGPAFKPDEVISALVDCSRVSSPSATALSVLSHRAAVAADQFYPPQIVEVLSLFGRIGFGGSQDLFSLIVSRKSDVLSEASPRRIVTLIEAFANLQLPLFHPAIWPDMRAELVRVMPQLKRGITTVLRSLSKLGCTDTELVGALMAQAECLEESGEIEREYYVHALEAVSRINKKFIAKKFSDKKFSTLQNAELLVAGKRAGIPDIGNETDLFPSGLSGYDFARVMGLLGRSGIKIDQDIIFERIEGLLKDKDFCHRMMPYTLWNSVLTSDESSNDFFKLVMSKLVGLDRLAADKLLALLRVGKVIGTDTSDLEALLSITARQLSLREARYLWEVMPGIVPTTSLAPLIPRGQEAAELDIETVGPYSLYRKSEGLQLLAPAYQVYRPGSLEVRRDMQLRLSALERAAGQPIDVCVSF